MPAKAIDIFPPAKGLFKPYKAFNPLLAGGRATTLNNWRIRNGAYELVEGLADIADQSLNNSVNNKLLTDYKSSSQDDIIYVNGQSLRYIVRGGTETEVTASFLAANDQNRLSYVRFRNRFLIGTPNDTLNWYDPENHTTREAGVAAPSGTPTGATGVAGVLTGDYKIKYTFENDQGHESDPSTASATVTASSDKINWATIVAGPTGTSKRHIYRTAAGGASYLFLATIDDNTTTTYTDNIADISLGTQVEEDNTVPITNIKQVFASSSRVYLVDSSDGIKLWASKIDPTTSAPNWEAYPSSLQLDLPFLGGRDDMQAGMFYDGDIYVFGRLSFHRISGDVATGVTIHRMPFEMGLFSPFAWQITPRGIVFLNNTRQLYLFNNTEGMTNLGAELQAELDTIDVDAGLDGPDMSYDPQADAIYLHYGITSGGNTKGILFDLASNGGSTGDWDFDISYYSESQNTLYGTENGDSTLRSWFGYKKAGSQFSDQRIEFFPWSPNPGNFIRFLRLRLILRAQVIISNIPPTLKVEYSLDGGNLYFTKFVDFSKDFLVPAAGEAPVVVPRDIPVYETARSIAIRITSVNTSAALNNNVELYRLQAIVEDLTEAKTESRIQGEDNPLGIG